MSTTRTKEKSEGKRQRVPMGGHRSKLQLSKEDQKAFENDGFVTRWINDVDGRIQRAQAGGWEFVEPEEAQSIGSWSLNKGDGELNGKVSMIVSKGGFDPIRGFLMKISKDFYDEDQMAKEEKLRGLDESLRQGSPGGAAVENQYIPKEGITVRN